jgi:hypothetical protein
MPYHHRGFRIVERSNTIKDVTKNSSGRASKPGATTFSLIYYFSSKENRMSQLDRPTFVPRQRTRICATSQGKVQHRQSPGRDLQGQFRLEISSNLTFLCHFVWLCIALLSKRMKIVCFAASESLSHVLASGGSRTGIISPETLCKVVQRQTMAEIPAEVRAARPSVAVGP